MLKIFLTMTPLTILAQVLTLDLPDEVCVDERSDVINNSTGLIRYEWDFCGDDFEIEPTINSSISISSMGLNRGMEIIKENGEFYGLFADFNDGQLFLVSLGDSIDGTSPEVSG